MPRQKKKLAFWPVSDVAPGKPGDAICCVCGRAIGLHSDCRFSSDGHHHLDCAKAFHKGERKCEECPNYKECTFDGKIKTVGSLNDR